MKKSIQEILDTYKYRDKLPKFEIDGKPALTGIDGTQIGDYVILTVRDPLCAYEEDSAAEIASKMQDARLVAKTGLYATYTGDYKGARISIVSGGSGSPALDIILNEFMIYSQADTFLRVGGSGSWNENVHPGDIVISSGAVRDEGLSHHYIVPQYPAVASYELVLALAQAATLAQASFHVGITRSSDSDYCAWGKPSVGGYLQPQHTQVIDYYNRAGILNTDCETSAILTLTSLFGRRGSSICSIGDNTVLGEPFQAGAGHEKAIAIALEGLAILHQWDLNKQKSSLRYWVPSISEG